MRSPINPGRPFRLISTVAVLGLAASATPAVSSASTHKVQDVRAKLTHDGTLEVNGGHRGNAVALRLGDRTQVQVDVGDDGSPDFSVKRRFIARIAVDARAAVMRPGFLSMSRQVARSTTRDACKQRKIPDARRARAS